MTKQTYQPAVRLLTEDLERVSLILAGLDVTSGSPAWDGEADEIRVMGCLLAIRTAARSGEFLLTRFDELEPIRHRVLLVKLETAVTTLLTVDPWPEDAEGLFRRLLANTIANGHRMTPG